MCPHKIVVQAKKCLTIWTLMLLLQLVFRLRYQYDEDAVL